MDALTGFWIAVDDIVQDKMMRYTHLQMQKRKYECVWDNAEAVIYSAEMLKFHIIARVKAKTLNVQLTITNRTFSINIEYNGNVTTCSDLTTVRRRDEPSANESFAFNFSAYMRNSAVHIAIQHFSRTDGYVYKTTVQQPQHCFFIYKPTRGIKAMLRMYIAYGDERHLGYVLFYEKFYISTTRYPKAFDSFIPFSNTQQLWDIMRNAFNSQSNWNFQTPCHFWDDIEYDMGKVLFLELSNA